MEPTGKGISTANPTVPTLLAQRTEKGEAQAATKARDEALEALMDWLSDFIAISRIALEDDSQLLEMF